MDTIPRIFQQFKIKHQQFKIKHQPTFSYVVVLYDVVVMTYACVAREHVPARRAAVAQAVPRQRPPLPGQALQPGEYKQRKKK